MRNANKKAGFGFVHHQCRICEDTVRNPLKGVFLGGPTAEEAEEILMNVYHYTDKQIARLKSSKANKDKD